MCESIKKYRVPRTAKKDIRVIKLYYDKEVRCGSARIMGRYPTMKELNTKGREFTSIVQNHEVRLGDKVKAYLELQKCGRYYDVIGFYSYSPKKVDRGWGYHIEVECIIPKGSKYYFIRDTFENVYISDTLIINKVVETAF